MDYSTSSESESEREIAPVQAKKRKLLPTLSATLAPAVPKDDPSQHQGRIRSQPFVDGQFATHIYAPISTSILHNIIESVIKDVREACKDLELFSLLEVPKQEGVSDDVSTETGKELPEELHLSVSRPLFLRSHQRDLVTKTVKDIARRTNSFHASFASFGILNNDEGTRSFLVIEIGAGHAEFSNISTALTPLLTELRQPAYYSSPRYHVSIAWILTTAIDAPKFPESLQKTLQDKFGEPLREIVLEINEICTKIGKTTTRCKLTT